MDESPVAALRVRPGASILAAAELVARGQAAALFSAGHTGATVIAAHQVLGLLPGVERPALATTVPTQTGSAVLLDSGATVACRAHHLVQFAVMGVSYARRLLSIDEPRVGLLSTGEEEVKGTSAIREAHRRLKSEPLSFVGNVEARDLFSGQADVIVCDGFTGNVALKVGEGVVELVETLLQDELSKTLSTRLAQLLSRRAYRRLLKRMDYSEYGGAPLLGTSGLCIVGHGRSSAKAVHHAIALAHRLASDRLPAQLALDVQAQSERSRPRASAVQSSLESNT
jgi:glycerol-3-phosphate acyltransferase PlsX